jgi:hypothetical protein
MFLSVTENVLSVIVSCQVDSHRFALLEELEFKTEVEKNAESVLGRDLLRTPARRSKGGARISRHSISGLGVRLLFVCFDVKIKGVWLEHCETRAVGRAFDFHGACSGGLQQAVDPAWSWKREDSRSNLLQVCVRARCCSCAEEFCSSVYWRSACEGRGPRPDCGSVRQAKQENIGSYIVFAWFEIGANKRKCKNNSIWSFFKQKKKLFPRICARILGLTIAAADEETFDKLIRFRTYEKEWAAIGLELYKAVFPDGKYTIDSLDEATQFVCCLYLSATPNVDVLKCRLLRNARELASCRATGQDGYPTKVAMNKLTDNMTTHQAIELLNSMPGVAQQSIQDLQNYMRVLGRSEWVLVIETAEMRFLFNIVEYFGYFPSYFASFANVTSAHSPCLKILTPKRFSSTKRVRK